MTDATNAARTMCRHLSKDIFIMPGLCRNPKKGGGQQTGVTKTRLCEVKFITGRDVHKMTFTIQGDLFEEHKP
jgi:hypothetical protein